MLVSVNSPCWKFSCIDSVGCWPGSEADLLTATLVPRFSSSIRVASLCDEDAVEGGGRKSGVVGFLIAVLVTVELVVVAGGGGAGATNAVVLFPLAPEHPEGPASVVLTEKVIL